MQRIETAISQASRGKPLLLVCLIQELISRGYSIDRMVKFAERRYHVPHNIAKEAILSVVIH